MRHASTGSATPAGTTRPAMKHAAAQLPNAQIEPASHGVPSGSGVKPVVDTSGRHTWHVPALAPVPARLRCAGHRQRRLRVVEHKGIDGAFVSLEPL